MPRAVRIEPGMQLQPAFVRLIHRELERIVPRIGRSPHPSRQVLRPRLVRRCVESVGGRPHLEDHGVEPENRSPVEHRDQLLLLFARREPGNGGPVDVRDRCNPHPSKLAPDRRRWRQILYGIYRSLSACSVEGGEHEK
jgi:hypothetical protein